MDALSGSKVGDDGEDSDSEEVDDDEFGLKSFPRNTSPDKIEDEEEDDIFIKTTLGMEAVNEQNQNENEWNGIDGLELNRWNQTIRGQHGTKRKWSTRRLRENEDDAIKQRRKRRRVFDEQIDNALSRGSGSERRDRKDSVTVNHLSLNLYPKKDEKDGNRSDLGIGAVLQKLRVSVFGRNRNGMKRSFGSKSGIDGKAKIRSDDSFAVALKRKRNENESADDLNPINITKMDRESQCKLLHHFSVKGSNEMTLSHCTNDISPLRAFQSTFTRNRVSVYGHNDASSWKVPYRLILDQKERDRNHVEKHSVMGNYGLFTEKMRMFKKDEFRNPVPEEEGYSNYGLSLSFMFLQEKISEFEHGHKSNTRSFLETESRIKSDRLLPFKEVMAIKKQMSSAMWTKNEICTTFNDGHPQNENERNRVDRGYTGQHQRDLIKSADWLSTQVLHGLKPANLGGNPFKKRRRKSPFPLIRKPKDFKAPKSGNASNSNRTEKRNVVTQAQLALQKKQQDKFEREMMGLSHLSEMMESTEKPPPPPPKTKIVPNPDPPNNTSSIAVSTERMERDSDSELSSSKETESSLSSVDASPDPVAAVTTKQIRVSPPKPKRDPTPRRKEQVKSAIERAKRLQLSNKRQVQLLPMKRRTFNSMQSTSTSSNEVHSVSLSPSPSPSMKEPSPKKSKLSNGNSHDLVKKEISPTDSMQNGLRSTNTHKTPRVFSFSSSKSRESRSGSTVSNHNPYQTPPNVSRRNGTLKLNGRKVSVSASVDSVLSFMATFRRMVRAQGKLDMEWLEKGLHCLNALDAETRTMVYQSLIHEAKTYNRFKLSLNIQRHFVSMT